MSDNIQPGAVGQDNPSLFRIAATFDGHWPAGGANITTPHGTVAPPEQRAGGRKLRSRETKRVEFKLQTACARSVKLAADFTDWEQAAIQMKKKTGGVWRTVVSLPPGEYAYRFIVDGNWHDDPKSAKLAVNPFGTNNAVVNVS